MKIRLSTEARKFFSKKSRKKEGEDLYLHQYKIMIRIGILRYFCNKKLDRVWADRQTLNLVCNELRKEFAMELAMDSSKNNCSAPAVTAATASSIYCYSRGSPSHAPNAAPCSIFASTPASSRTWTGFTGP